MTDVISSSPRARNAIQRSLINLSDDEFRTVRNTILGEPTEQGRSILRRIGREAVREARAGIQTGRVEAEARTQPQTLDEIFRGAVPQQNNTQQGGDEELEAIFRGTF